VVDPAVRKGAPTGQPIDVTPSLLKKITKFAARKEDLDEAAHVLVKILEEAAQ